MKDMSRGNRLHQVKLLKKKRSVYWGRTWEKTPEQLGKLSQTPANCANDCCSNPRKYSQLTFKEPIQLDRMNSYLNE
jgi:hypothetical protein